MRAELLDVEETQAVRGEDALGREERK